MPKKKTAKIMSNGRIFLGCKGLAVPFEKVIFYIENEQMKFKPFYPGADVKRGLSAVRACSVNNGYISIVIPGFLRQLFGLSPGDKVHITPSADGGFVVSSIKSSCAVCGASEETVDIDGLFICKGCAEKIKDGIGG